VSRAPDRPFTAFLIAGEESGDALGANLMEALRAQVPGELRFMGVGGSRMERLRLSSMFPMRDINHVGATSIVANLPRIFNRMQQASRAIAGAEPDVFVMIDCPGFNLGVARRVRKKNPRIPIVDYVSPTVWVWRPRRAPRMARFVDHLLAILPFEPEVHERLKGPPTTYVGHPLIEKIDRLRHSARLFLSPPQGRNQASQLGERAPGTTLDVEIFEKEEHSVMVSRMAPRAINGPITRRYRRVNRSSPPWS